jgi:hypothetical protein
MAQIPFYLDPAAESVLRLGPSGKSLVFVSNVAHVSGHVENAFDDQTSVGKNFGRTRFRGVKPATFTITWVVLPEEEDHFWQSVAPLFRQKGKEANSPPMACINPQINRWGIDTVSVVSADIDPPDARNGRGITLQVKEWTPAPTAAKPVNSGKVNRDPLNLGGSGGVPVAVEANQSSVDNPNQSIEQNQSVGP